MQPASNAIASSAPPAPNNLRRLACRALWKDNILIIGADQGTASVHARKQGRVMTLVYSMSVVFLVVIVPKRSFVTVALALIAIRGIIVIWRYRGWTYYSSHCGSGSHRGRWWCGCV